MENRKGLNFQIWSPALLGDKRQLENTCILIKLKDEFKESLKGVRINITGTISDNLPKSNKKKKCKAGQCN